jgi:hypothetical protein
MSSAMPSINPVVGFARRKATAARYIARQEFHRLCRKNDFAWRYIANLNSWFEFQKHRAPLSALQQRVLTDLVKNGISQTSIEEFFGDGALFIELQRAVEKREAELGGAIANRRFQTSQGDAIKSYLISLFDRKHTYQPNDIFIRIASHSQIVALANAYFGMFTKLCYCNVWHNFPMCGEPRESQLWHRDPEDRYILKLFVYLTDVDERSGPTYYAPGTHAKGPIKKIPEATLRKEGSAYNLRSDDAQMAKVVPVQQWIRALGPKGTMLFIDTSGFHKGGFVRDNDRILYNCMFNSSATSYPASLRPKLSSIPKLGRAESYLLGD